MRLATDKWIETQQIMFKERNQWQQGKEVLVGRIELVEKEIKDIEEKVAKSTASVDEANKKHTELESENDHLKAVFTQLTTQVSAMEAEIKRFSPMLPEPTREKLKPLFARIPEDPAKTIAAVAERYQNVLGILNEANKANGEILVNYEVHTLGNGRPVEVQAIYIGLAQGYYVSAGGEAGICTPNADGWKWTPENSIAPRLTQTIEILLGKQTAEFVPLPVKIQ